MHAYRRRPATTPLARLLMLAISTALLILVAPPTSRDVAADILDARRVAPPSIDYGQVPGLIGSGQQRRLALPAPARPGLRELQTPAYVAPRTPARQAVRGDQHSRPRKGITCWQT
jgi:hypothetical protein